MNRITVPFFISHQGCPHTCVFCDQRQISGSAGLLPDGEQIAARIRNWLSMANGRPLEVAFFGGTFTALPQEVQLQLLYPVQAFIADGKVDSIRVSTRPDSISREVVQHLCRMGVRTIEIGVQSMDDAVLAAAGRGHTAADSAAAIGCIAAEGVLPGAQLMPGLPGDTLRKSMQSLERVIAAGAAFVRIYPVVVLRGTALSALFHRGLYNPLTVEAGVDICKRMLHKAMQAGIPVIRTGLQNDDGLNGEAVVAGCWHPAFGQLVRSELYHDLAAQMLLQCGKPAGARLYCHPARVADLVGHGRRNLLRLNALVGGTLRIVADAGLEKDQIRLESCNRSLICNVVTDLEY